MDRAKLFKDIDTANAKVAKYYQQQRRIAHNHKLSYEERRRRIDILDSRATRVNRALGKKVIAQGRRLAQRGAKL